MQGDKSKDAVRCVQERAQVRDERGIPQYLLPHPKINGKHSLCELTLTKFAPIVVEVDDAEWLRNLPTCAVVA